MSMPRYQIDGVEFYIGQKWRDTDKRGNRIVEVVGWDIRLKRVQIKFVRTTWAQASRFGRNGGYVLA